MGRKKKELEPEEEVGNVLDGINLTQHTGETWAVQFRHQGKPCSKLLYGNKQTAASVRELVGIWLCFKSSNSAAVASELQQLQHNYEHYSFLIEALKHSRSVEALWKVVGKFCRGEFEVKAILNQGQTRASVDGNSSPANALHHLPTVDGDEAAVNSQSIGGTVGSALEQHQHQQIAVSVHAHEAGSHHALPLTAGRMQTTAGVAVLTSHALADASSAALSATQMQMLEPSSAAAAAAAAAVTGLPSAAGFPVNTAAAAAALQAALMYARGTETAANMLPFMWQHQLSGMHMHLAYPPAPAGHYNEHSVGAGSCEALTAATAQTAAEGNQAADTNTAEAYQGDAQMTNHSEPPALQAAETPPTQCHSNNNQSAVAASVPPAAGNLSDSHPVQQHKLQQLIQGNQVTQQSGQEKEEAACLGAHQPGHAADHATATQEGHGGCSSVETAPPSQDDHPTRKLDEQQQEVVQEHEQVNQTIEAAAGRPSHILQSLEGAMAAAAAAAGTSLQIPEEVQRQLLAAGGNAMDDSAAQSLLLWWQHAVAGTYPAFPAVAPATGTLPTDATDQSAPPSPKRQRV